MRYWMEVSKIQDVLPTRDASMEVEFADVHWVSNELRDLIFKRHEAEFIQFLQEKGYQVTEE